MAEDQRKQAAVEPVRHLLAAIRGVPGRNLADTRRSAGLGRNAFAAALGGLVEAGLVHRVATARGVLLFPDRPGIEECLEQVKALTDARVRVLHDFLARHEICPHRAVVEHAAQAWDWGDEITRWRLRLLEKADLAQGGATTSCRGCGAAAPGRRCGGRGFHRGAGT